MQQRFGLYEGLAELQLKSRASVVTNTPGVGAVAVEGNRACGVADNVLLKFSSWRDSQKPYP